MKAITQDRYGDADVLTLRDIERPTPAEGEVLVEVRAAGCGPDVWHTVTWKGSADVRSLWNRPIRIAFHLDGARLAIGPEDFVYVQLAQRHAEVCQGHDIIGLVVQRLAVLRRGLLRAPHGGQHHHHCGVYVDPCI